MADHPMCTGSRAAPGDDDAVQQALLATLRRDYPAWRIWVSERCWNAQRASASHAGYEYKDAPGARELREKLAAS